MARPQLKDGFTRIANELLEAVCRLNISGNEMRILLYIIRRTYGFGKKYAKIPRSEIAKAVGTTPDRVTKALKKLKEWNIIEHQPNKGLTPQIISIQKNYEKWIPYEISTGGEIATGGKNDRWQNEHQTGGETDTRIGGKNDTCRGGEMDTHTYKEKKENYKESIKESTPAKKSYGSCGKVMLSDEEYEQLLDDYDRDIAEDYIQRMDSWLEQKNFPNYDCAVKLREWLKRDSVPMRDKSIDKYKCVINKF